MWKGKPWERQTAYLTKAFVSSAISRIVWGPPTPCHLHRGTPAFYHALQKKGRPQWRSSQQNLFRSYYTLFISKIFDNLKRSSTMWRHLWQCEEIVSWTFLSRRKPRGLEMGVFLASSKRQQHQLVVFYSQSMSTNHRWNRASLQKRWGCELEALLLSVWKQLGTIRTLPKRYFRREAGT